MRRKLFGMTQNKVNRGKLRLDSGNRTFHASVVLCESMKDGYTSTQLWKMVQRELETDVTTILTGSQHVNVEKQKNRHYWTLQYGSTG